MRIFQNVIFDLCYPGKCSKAIQTVELQEMEYQKTVTHPRIKRLLVCWLSYMLNIVLHQTDSSLFMYYET